MNSSLNISLSGSIVGSQHGHHGLFHRASHDYCQEYKRLVGYLENELQLIDNGTAAKKKSLLINNNASLSSSSFSSDLKTKLDNFDIKKLGKSSLTKPKNIIKYKRMAMHLNNLAFAFNRLNEPSKAIACYKKSLEIKEAIVANFRLIKESPSKRSVDSTASSASSNASNRKLNSKSANNKKKETATARATKNIKFKLSNEEKLKSNLSISYNNVGATYSYLNKHEESIQYYEKSLNISKNLLDLITASNSNESSTKSMVIRKYKQNMANQYNNIGLAYNRLSKHALALTNHEEALKLRESLAIDESKKSPVSAHPDIADTLNNIGNTYFNLNNLAMSNNYHERALKMRQDLFIMLHGGDSDMNGEERKLSNYNKDISSSFYNLGIVNYHLGNYEKSLDYLEKAIKQRNQRQLSFKPNNLSAKDSSGPAFLDCFNYIGNIYFKLGKYTKSIEYFNRELKIFDDLIESTNSEKKSLDYILLNKAGCLNNIGACWALLKDYKESFDYMSKSLKIREDLNNKYDFNPITTTTTTSLKLFRANKILKLDLMNSYNNLGVINFNLGDYQSSLSYFEKENQLNRQLLSSDDHRKYNFKQLNMKAEQIYKNLGICNYNLEKYDAAIENLNEALNYNRLNTLALANDTVDDYLIESREYYLNLIDVCHLRSKKQQIEVTV